MVISPEWLAGFFDGEGCISATVAGKRRRVILRLSLVNTDYAVMRTIAVEYNGQFVVRKASRPGWKTPYHVIWTNTQAKSLLAKIGHLIILKRQQVKLALAFLELRDSPERFTLELVSVKNHKSGTVPKRRITQDMLAREEAIKQEFHRLNRKGAA